MELSVKATLKTESVQAPQKTSQNTPKAHPPEQPHARFSCRLCAALASSRVPSTLPAIHTCAQEVCHD